MLSLQRAFPDYANIGVLDLAGRPVCSAIAGPKNTRVDDRGYFQQALRMRSPVAEYVVGRLSARRSLTFALALEDDQGVLRGVVFAALDLDRAAERLRATELPDYLEVFVTTQDATVLASTVPGNALLGRPLPDPALRARVQHLAAPGAAPLEAAPFDLVRTIGNYQPTQVILAARARPERLLAPALRRLQLQLAALALATLAAGTLAWWLGHRLVVAPTVRLLTRMRRLEQDEPADAAPATLPASRELGALDAAFSRMQQQLLARAQERRRLLDHLKSAQDNVLAAQRLSRLGHWQLDTARQEFLLSETASEILRCHSPHPVAALLASSPPQDRQRLQAALLLAISEGERIDLEHRIRHEDGSVTWLRTMGERQPSPDDGQSLLRGSIQDVTERKSSEMRVGAQIARLQLLHQITRAITDRSDLGSILRVLVDRLELQMPVEFCLTATYHADERCIEISHVGAASQPLASQLDLLPGRRLPANVNGLARAVQGHLVHEPDTRALQFELPLRLAEAGLHSLVLVPLPTPGGVSGLVLAARRPAGNFTSSDCEFLRQLSEQVALAIQQAALYGALEDAFDDLRRSQQAALQHERLRALGEMASGIAHDINNGISPLSLYIESLQAYEHGLSDVGREKLQTMELAVNSISKTVERMRHFYRSAEGDALHVPVSLNDAVRQVIELTRARWHDIALKAGAAIEVTTDLHAGLPEVSCDEVELRDALTNLVFNAVDAMPAGGTLHLRTRPWAEADASPGAEVSVIDTGQGMDDETRRRCIEPFFTTKGQRGTGLGLAMVYGMMRRHQGTVAVDSSLGQGTAVHLRFPAPGPTAAVPAPPPPAAPIAAGPLRLLVVDDDPQVRRPLIEALRGDGHEVLEADGGEVALAQLRDELQAGRRIHAVVTDLGMPRMDGAQLALHIQAMGAHTRVVMLTGWGHRMNEDGELPPGVDVLLSKPPKLHLLRAALAMQQAAAALPPPGPRAQP